MNIKGMNIIEISSQLQHYVTDYFKDCKLSGLDEGMFAESCQFDFTEVNHLIPPEYHELYNDTDRFNCASGYVLFETKSDEFRGSVFMVMLISDKEYSDALFLLLQEENDITHVNKDIILADFIKQEIGQLS